MEIKIAEHPGKWKRNKKKIENPVKGHKNEIKLIANILKLYFNQ